MDSRVIDFLTNERVACLATIVSDDSTHASPMHYYFEEEPLAIYFLTSDDTKKFEKIAVDGKCKASVVIGFDEKKMEFIQMDGELTKVTGTVEFERLKVENLKKNPHHAKYYEDPKHIFLKFSPTWWKFQSLLTDPKIELSSKD